MKQNYYRLFFILLAALLPTLSSAQDDPAATPPALIPVVSGLHLEHGKIDIDHGLASIDMPEGLGYLSPDEADIFLRQIAHYPAKIKNLGIIVPSEVAIGSRASWFALITGRQDGHIKESGPQELNPGALIQKLQEGNRTRNAVLATHGYDQVGVEITGWAHPPHYDGNTHKAVWGLEMLPHGRNEPKVSYHIQILGRRGAIALSIIGMVEQLPVIDAAAEKIASAFHFNPPHRYEDFTWATDSKANYDIANIIAQDSQPPKNTPSAAPSSYNHFWLSVILLAGVVLLYTFMRKRRN